MATDAAKLTKQIRDRIAVIDTTVDQLQTERSRLSNALDALVPQRQSAAKARAARAAKAKPKPRRRATA